MVLDDLLRDVDRLDGLGGQLRFLAPHQVLQEEYRHVIERREVDA